MLTSQFGDIISECRHLLTSLQNVSLRFVKRSANLATHAIARAYCSSDDRVFFSGDFPPYISDVLLHDLC